MFILLPFLSNNAFFSQLKQIQQIDLSEIKSNMKERRINFKKGLIRILIKYQSIFLYAEILYIQYLPKMEQLIFEAHIKTHTRTTDFFLTKYKKFLNDVEPNKCANISDIQLECLGYGIFDKEAVLANFYNYTMDMLSKLRTVKDVNLRSIKINLNGFKLDPKSPILRNIAQQIVMNKDNLKTLWFHTSNLEGCTLKDFQELFSLCLTLSDINFENFSLQCANWRFERIQPSFDNLFKIFKDKVDSFDDVTKIQNGFWRLQISGWYYSEKDAKNFLGFKGPNDTDADLQEFNEDVFADRRQKFHVSMERMLKSLLEGMENIKELELDMRNYHDMLKMKNLKKKLDNVTKQDRYEKSIMSKRFDVQADVAEKELKLSIVM